MTTNETRQLLIRVGAEIIGNHGFNPTGLNVILKTAGVPKGSFYYYFASKEDFGLAVIDESAIRYAEQIERFLTDKTKSPLQRIRLYLESGLETIREHQCKRGCLIGSLGQELSSQNEIFRARLDQVFENWKQQFRSCLQESIDQGELNLQQDAAELAEFLLSGWQGAILRSKMSSSITPLKIFIDTLFTQILISNRDHQQSRRLS